MIFNKVKDFLNEEKTNKLKRQFFFNLVNKKVKKSKHEFKIDK